MQSSKWSQCGVSRDCRVKFVVLMKNAKSSFLSLQSWCKHISRCIAIKSVFFVWIGLFPFWAFFVFSIVRICWMFVSSLIVKFKGFVHLDNQKVSLHPQECVTLKCDVAQHHPCVTSLFKCELQWPFLVKQVEGACIICSMNNNPSSPLHWFLGLHQSIYYLAHNLLICF